MRRLPACLLALLCACSPGATPRELASYDLRIGEAEREDLRRILSDFATAEGLAAYPASQHQGRLASPGSRFRPGMAMILRRHDRNDRELSASASYNDPSRVRLTFLSQGAQDLPAAARDRLFTALARRWPASLPVPVLPDGRTAPPQHLVAGSDRYRIHRTAAAQYGLPKDSPLLVPALRFTAVCVFYDGEGRVSRALVAVPSGDPEIDDEREKSLIGMGGPSHTPRNGWERIGVDFADDYDDPPGTTFDGEGPMPEYDCPTLARRPASGA